MPFSDDIPVARRQSDDTNRLHSGRSLWLLCLGGGGLAAVAAVVGIGLSRPAAVPTQATPVLQEPVAAAPPVAIEPDESSESEPNESVVAAANDETVAANSSTAILGHFAYEEAPDSSMTALGDGGDREIRLRTAAAKKYREMAAAARQAGVSLVPISGFRSQAIQEQLFFQRAQARSLRPQERALVSAPPGYSEHHTGYAIDLGDANAPHANLNVTFEATPAFRWLKTNAARFGFELSFPRDNPQGVSYEPWHWRFVGDRDSLATFYANRPTKPQASTAQ
ncbi:MAG: M15 family metallopeptidase [Cyanobacteria bacterium P01_F01_bin.33]